MFKDLLATMLYNALDVGLASGVYDAVPQTSDAALSSVFPFTTIGDIAISPLATDDSTGADAIVTLHQWSRYKGNQEIDELQDAIFALLHRQELTIGGNYVVINCEWETTEETFLDPDGITRHGVMRFRILVDEV